MRARIVLACAEGRQNKEVAAELGLDEANGADVSSHIACTDCVTVALACASDANQFILAQSGRTLLCAHHRAQDQTRHLSQRGCTTRRDRVLHRTSQCPSKAVPMDKISRRHSQLNRALLCLQSANQSLKCRELLVQDTSPGGPSAAGVAPHIEYDGGGWRSIAGRRPSYSNILSRRRGASRRCPRKRPDTFQ
jgi:hypothetical protein